MIKQQILEIVAQFLKPELILLYFSLTVAVALFWFNKFPTIHGFINFTNALNTKGGNILILTLMVVVSNSVAMKFIYFMVDLSIQGKLTKDNALGLAAFSYVTAQVSGAILGAWLKALSPQDIITTSGVIKSETKVETSPFTL